MKKILEKLFQTLKIYFNLCFQIRNCEKSVKTMARPIDYSKWKDIEVILQKKHTYLNQN